jgi:hypothetical protein
MITCHFHVAALVLKLANELLSEKVKEARGEERQRGSRGCASLWKFYFIISEEEAPNALLSLFGCVMYGGVPRVSR